MKGFRFYAEMQEAEAIGSAILANLRAILAHYEANTVEELQRTVYRDTECGAWMSVKLHSGEWQHTGNLSGIQPGDVRALLLGSIVENSDAEIVGKELDLMTYEAPEEAVSAFGRSVEDAEAEADVMWNLAEAEREEGVQASQGCSPDTLERRQ